MKIFLVYRDVWEYDGYDGFVLAARSEEEVRDIIRRHDGDFSFQTEGIDRFVDAPCTRDFNARWDKVNIKEIRPEDLSRPTLIISSFAAG